LDALALTQLEYILPNLFILRKFLKIGHAECIDLFRAYLFDWVTFGWAGVGPPWAMAL
jgi:hypothetical protein